jgi:hypothetical protein
MILQAVAGSASSQEDARSVGGYLG